MCSVCRDFRNFNVKVNDAKRIRMNIEQILPSETVDTSITKGKELRKLFEESRNAHFMCGYCTKVNINELEIEENKITDLVLKFLAYVKTYANKNQEKYFSIYYQIQRNLRGNYPKIAHNLEQYFFKCVNEESKT